MEEDEEVILSPNLSHMKLAEAELKGECEKLWAEINKIHERVNKNKSSSGVLGDSEQPLLQILQEKSKHLNAELHLLETKQPKALPTNPTILKAQLQKELNKTNKELKELLEFIQSQRKELEEELVRESNILAEHHQLKRTLESNLESLETAEDDPQRSRSSQEKELHRRKKSAASQQQKLMRNLAAVVTKHFPKPTEKPHKAGGQEQRSKEYMSLLEILEKISEILSKVWIWIWINNQHHHLEEDPPKYHADEILMNKCMDSKHDPYVIVDETSWPPYIELLLRCGIAVRHPQDCRRIRLVPFHL